MYTIDGPFCYLAIMSQEDGVGLDVSVDDAIRVQERESLEARFTHCGNLYLIQSERNQVKYLDINWK